MVIALANVGAGESSSRADSLDAVSGLNKRQPRTLKWLLEWSSGSLISARQPLANAGVETVN